VVPSRRSLGDVVRSAVHASSSLSEAASRRTAARGHGGNGCSLPSVLAVAVGSSLLSSSSGTNIVIIPPDGSGDSALDAPAGRERADGGRQYDRAEETSLARRRTHPRTYRLSPVLRAGRAAAAVAAQRSLDLAAAPPTPAPPTRSHHRFPYMPHRVWAVDPSAPVEFVTCCGEHGIATRRAATVYATLKGGWLWWRCCRRDSLQRGALPVSAVPLAVEAGARVTTLRPVDGVTVDDDLPPILA
jgi:hypothetical protein